MRVRERLEFEVDWVDQFDGQPVVTVGRFRVRVDGEQFWPTLADDSDLPAIEWYMDDLLAHLARHWARLLVEHSVSLPVQPLRPSELWFFANQRWQSQPEEVVTEEEEVILEFERVHDVSQAFAGIFDLSPLWLVRSNYHFILDNGNEAVQLSFDHVVYALNQLGSCIADRLSSCDAQKWSQLIAKWNARDSGDSGKLLSLATGLPYKVANDLVRENLLTFDHDVLTAARESEVKVAARMVGQSLPLDSVKRVLRAVLDCGKVELGRLDEFAEIIQSEIRQYSDAAPHVQGEIAARRLRILVKEDQKTYLDVRAIAEKVIEIPLYELELPASVEAISCWGPSHGPAIILNENVEILNLSKKAIVPRKRATISHELGHLLLDRGDLLVAVDKFADQQATPIEQRARAFAASLLLPTEEAASFWAKAGEPLDSVGLSEVLRTLGGRFKVSKALASWKLEHVLPSNDPRRLEMKRAFNELNLMR